VHEYRNPGSAERYVVTRSLVRLVLGAHLQIAPRDVPVSRTDTGKPVIAGGVHFNVSHSGELVLFGLCEDRPIGVDVERKRDVQRVDLLVNRWLDEVERQQFERLISRGLTASDAFLRVWSLKEARLKALGVGIAGSAGAPLHTVVAHALDELLDDLSVGDREAGYVGAVAFA
jgi:4'-phosphopantetheinyl transferase